MTNFYLIEILPKEKNLLEITYYDLLFYLDWILNL